MQVVDFDNIHSLGSQNSLENGQKVDISRRKNDTGREKNMTIGMTQRSFAKSRYRLKRPVNEGAGHLCTFTRKQAHGWSFWSIYVGNEPQQRL